MLVAVSVSVGELTIPLTKVVPAMLGLSDPTTNFVVQTLRLPQALNAALAGAAFGMSGAIFQSVTRNPLASPDVLGVEAGAAAGAVFVIVAGAKSGLGTTVGALAGGLATALLVYVLSYQRRGVSGAKLVLIGISVAATLTSVTAYLLVRASVNTAQEAVAWLSGSLNGRGWEDLRPVALVLLVAIPLLSLMARQLEALLLGDATASGLGVRVEASRRALLLVGAILAATATASAGPVTFVALVAPQLAQRMARTTTARLGLAALVGAALTTAADLVGRLVGPPPGLPVGITTAILGAPYLLWFLARANNTER